MTHIEEIETQLDALWGGHTLATLRDEATLQPTGACFRSLRVAGRPRMVLLLCVTCEHVLAKLGPSKPNTVQPFGNWRDVSIFEAIVHTMMKGDFTYARERSSESGSAVLLIATSADSIARLETILRLDP